MRKRAAAAVLLLLIGGCGSIADMVENQRIYGGIQTDVRLIGHPYLPRTQPPEYFFPLILFGIFDIPLSFCIDTLLLPVTITIAATPDDKKR